MGDFNHRLAQYQRNKAALNRRIQITRFVIAVAAIHLIAFPLIMAICLMTNAIVVGMLFAVFELIDYYIYEQSMRQLRLLRQHKTNLRYQFQAEQRKPA